MFVWLCAKPMPARLLMVQKPSHWETTDKTMGKASKSSVKAGNVVSKKQQDPIDSPGGVSSDKASKNVSAEHLPPIGLVFVVIACSGFLLMFAFRDIFATGRIIGGAMDEAMLVRHILSFCNL